jgi:1-acyl-sn-glycerol-3-phosphate acyltransferase
VLYRTLELTLAPMLRAVYRPTVTGESHVPRNGAVILAANHQSFVDEFFTPMAARRQVAYLAKAEYFTGTGVRGAAMRTFFTTLGHVPVERGDARSAAGVIDLGVGVLAEGRALGIFPEGTRSPDGRLHKFRTGVARLALRSGAPVVPVGRAWHRVPIGVHFGAPLSFGERRHEERSSRVLREVTDTIRAAVQELSGQEYVDAFAQSSATAV